MKKLFAFAFLVASSLTLAGQVGIGTLTPNTHAVLELKSTGGNQGLIVPSLTTAQRTATAFTTTLGTGESGLLVFDTDVKLFYFWSGTQWTPVDQGGGGTGTVTNIATGTGLTGGPVSTSGTISLANTAVTPATYGSSTQVGQFAVDAQGRITGASNVTITGAAPTGSAGGDLSGNFPNPLVAKLQGSAVSATAPGTNQILKWNGSAWAPAADANSGGTVTSLATGTGLTGGTVTTTATIALANTTVAPATYGTATQVGQFTVDAQGRITGASNVTITGAAPTGAAGGDLTGTYPSPTVAASAVTSAKILDGTIATADVANLAITDAKIATGITASKVTPSATNGQVLTTVAGATVWAALPASGTVTTINTGTGLTGGPITTTGTLALANTAVVAGTYGSGTQVPSIVIDQQGRITTAKNNAISGVFTLPYAGSGTGATNLFSITTTSATGVAVYGTNSTTKYPSNGYLGGVNYGAFGTNQNYGVYGSNSNGGEYGWLGGGGYGAYGYNQGGNTGYLAGNTYAAYGLAANAASIGVYGTNNTTKYASIGYLGSTTYGVFGTHQTYAVYGKNSNTGDTGWLGGGGFGVYSSGQAGGTTTWSSSSDFRFKKNIATLNGSLEKILSMRGVEYDWRTDEFPQKNFTKAHDVGVIAQELKAILPEAVLQDAEGFYSVSYEKIIPLLIEAVKQQQSRITELEKGHDDLALLKAKIDRLEALLTPSATTTTIALKK